MSSVSKLAPSVFNPTCTTELAIEEAIVQALNESMSPKAQKVEDQSQSSSQTADNMRNIEHTQDLESERDDDELNDDSEHESDLLMSSEESLHYVSRNIRQSQTSFPSIENLHDLEQQQEEEEDSEQDEEYLYDDDDEDEDLIISSNDRAAILQLKYDKIMKEYSERQPSPIFIPPKQHIISFCK